MTAMNSPAHNHCPPVAIRNGRERAIQTLWFEGQSLLIVAPLFAYFFGATVGHSLLLLMLPSTAVTLWAALYNTAFDHVVRRPTHRAASDRPPRWCVLHAIALDANALVVTWPLIVALTALSWRDGFVAEVGLTLAYAAYGYCFRLAFDRLRPVSPSPHRRSDS
jgi:uncharacterized membrane protein